MDINEKWNSILGTAFSGPQDIEAGTRKKPKIPQISQNMKNKLLKVSANAKNNLQVKRPKSDLSFQSINEISSIGEEPCTPNKNEKGSLCNRFNLDSKVDLEIREEEEIIDSPKVIINPENVEKPPKIWISKSASMDDDLEGENKEEEV